ncbi:LysM peptidoglycan-binding domain-containing protein [Desulfuromonas sp. KJ2020]|uniref:LysM peptidoglycan-binding domain-containing protein n=1 Tax=Desulfuromonas sp. KJ2020 TaxID=2919173 RepID=UPI0020A800D5|nr:LysM peptidoglycan-binding domain-containing protein [Desulfuromonas sp. KJ2020]MCP3177035.1 LysM peptidoglycan-binding domain-containing protein [Desulfuromonas sp. KJ2020]
MKIPGAIALFLLLAGCTPTFLGGAGSGSSVPEESAASENRLSEHLSLLVHSDQAMAYYSLLDADVDLSSLDPLVLPDDDELLLLSDEQTPPDDEGVNVVPAEVTFDFPVVENEKVQYFIDYYARRSPTAFRRWLERSGRYLPMMRQIFAEEGLPQDLTYLAMIESGFNNRAYSWAHAAGPWQFIESTGKIFGLRNDWWRDERRDFEKSTRAAARFLRDLHRQFDGDWYLAIASYNAGGGKLRQAIRKYNTRDFWELSHGSYLQNETKNYVPKLLAVTLIAKEPEKYGFTDLEYEQPLDFEVARIPSATDLEIVADLCGVPYDEIKALNPELKRWSTPPGEKDYALRVPVGTLGAFTEKYAVIPADERANYARHRIRQGDTLLALAKTHGIRVDDIIALNNIKNPRALRVGMDLILPLKKGFTHRPINELSDDYVRSKRATYTVRKGDSLWSVARRFGVREKELRVWNRLGWSNVIRPGQTLIVSATSAKPDKTAAKKTGPVRKIVYRVKSGDTLWGIGRQFDVGTHQIMDWNNLSQEHVLRPGDSLTLMVRGDFRG